MPGFLRGIVQNRMEGPVFERPAADPVINKQMCDVEAQTEKAAEEKAKEVKEEKEAEEKAKDKEENAVETTERMTIRFLFFTSDLKSRTALEMKLDHRRKRNLSRAAKRNSPLPVVCRYTFVVDREYHGETVRIEGVNRFDSILMPPVSGQPNTDANEHSAKNLPPAIVLTVPLRQLVLLYNQVGDRLFRRNVRLGIADTMDVHRAMYKTLAEDAETFWFKNNGITILV